MVWHDWFFNSCCIVQTTYTTLSYRLNPLHNHGCGGAPTVTDRGNAILARLQLVEQSHKNT